MIFKIINDYNIKEICTHVVLNKIIDDKFKKFFNFFRVLIDFNAFDKVFINKIFAQKLNFELIFLKFFKILKIFDESAAVFDSITHYVDIYFKIFVVRENVRLTRFYITELFHWLIVFEISWFMKNKVNINFEKMIVEIFIVVEQSTSDFSIIFKKNINQIVNAFTKYEFIFMIFINENDSFIDVNVINVAAFSQLIKKKNYNLETFNLKDIKKLSISNRNRISLHWFEKKK